MLGNISLRMDGESRENDLQVVERLTSVVRTLADLGTADQRRGRNRMGQFVSEPSALVAQPLLEAALLAAAKRVKAREEGLG